MVDPREQAREAREKLAFTFAFAAGFKTADETSRQCISAMDDAWEEWAAINPSPVNPAESGTVTEGDREAISAAVKARFMPAAREYAARGSRPSAAAKIIAGEWDDYGMVNSAYQWMLEQGFARLASPTTGLKEALEPFAMAAERVHERTVNTRLLDVFTVGSDLTVGDLRRAAKAFANLPTEAGPTRGLCEDCPSVGYPTDSTRCDPYPRRRSLTNAAPTAAIEPEAYLIREIKGGKATVLAGHMFKSKDAADAAAIRLTSGWRLCLPFGVVSAGLTETHRSLLHPEQGDMAK